MNSPKILGILLIAGLLSVAAFADAPAKRSPNPPPTFTDVAYGEHPRQVLDLWKAPSDKPTPVVFHIHGGGWVNGDKNKAPHVSQYLAEGISVVSINYRYTTQAQAAGIMPPVSWPLSDAARALQFVRSKSPEWNIDKKRIGATGGSAGACTALWLALHDDLAESESSDPIARESTRLWCAAVAGAQTSLDPKQMKEWTPNSRYGGHAFGFMDPGKPDSRDKYFAEFLAQREKLLLWIKKYSPIEHASADDPPIYIFYKTIPKMGEEEKDPTHTANFGVPMHEKLKSLGVECEFVHPGIHKPKHTNMAGFLIDKLKER